jgi:hypothetical protein
MELFVGQTSLKGDFRRYAREFNYVELLAEPQVLPSIKRVRALVAEARDKVQFGVVLSPRVWEAGGAALQAYFLKVCAATQPTWVICRTPTSLRPGPSSERELAKKFEELRGLVGQAQLAWEPRGLWEPGAIARVAKSLNVTPVWSGMSPPAGDLGEGPAYVRFADLGVGARVNEGRLERWAVKAEHCTALYVVVEGRGAQRSRQILQGIFADPFAGLDGDAFADDSEDSDSEGDADDDFENSDVDDGDSEDSDDDFDELDEMFDSDE